MNNSPEGNISVEALEAELARLQALLSAKEAGVAMMKEQGMEVDANDPDKTDLEAEYSAIKAQLIELGVIQPELPNI